MRAYAPRIPKARYLPAGYPIRAPFAALLRDPPALAARIDEERAALGIGADDDVVMLMMGGLAMNGKLMASDAAALALGLRGRDRKVHVLAMCSGNAALQKQIEDVAAQHGSDRVQIHAVGRKDAASMAALMCTSRALITKPGGGTTNEALAVDLPMLLRRPKEERAKGPLGFLKLRPSYELAWERANRAYLEALPQSAIDPRRAEAPIAQDVDEGNLVSLVSDVLDRPRPHLDDVPARGFAAHARAIVRAMLEKRPAGPDGPLPVALDVVEEEPAQAAAGADDDAPRAS